MKKSFLLLCISFYISNLHAQNLGLEQVASGFSSPLDIVSNGDGYLYIVEQAGYIRRIPEDFSSAATLYMDIHSVVNQNGGEQGLLGLAFHPNFASNGYFYVNYINTSGNTRIVRYSRSTINPNVGDPNSAFILLSIAQPYSNHNGGNLMFGPDGYLYAGMGDGGSGGDPGNRAQDITLLLGKMLRIDVNNGNPYGIPPTNPFVNVAGADEIWAYGLRNPWRWSFDRLTGDLWIGDVGQDSWEEVDFQAAGIAGGQNYGWRCYEGNHTYNTSQCTGITNFTFPVFEYGHNNNGGYVITGGFVYRGSLYPGLYGKYIFCDEESGRFWVLTKSGSNITTVAFPNLHTYVPTFGEGNTGELYCADIVNGTIFRVEDLCSLFSVQATVTNASNATVNDGAITLSLSNGTAPYTYFWSTGQTTQNITSLLAGTYTCTVVDANGCAATVTAVVHNNCGAPNGLSATTVTNTSELVSWNSSNATSYRVYYRKNSGGPIMQVNTTTTSATLNNLLPNTLYRWLVRAYCAPNNAVFNSSTNHTFTTPLKLSTDVKDDEVTIYPTLSDGIFFLTNTQEEVALQINSISGKEVFAGKLLGGSRIDLTQLPAGIYLAKITAVDNQSSIQKLVISR